MHLYDRSIGLFGTNGIVAAGIGHAAGVGISARLRKTGRRRASPSSATARSTMAASTRRSISPACRSRPAVFVCENNLYATATPLAMATLNTGVATQGRGLRHSRRRRRRQRRARRLCRRCARRWSAPARGDGPTLIEAKTYRTVGHHEGDPVVGTYRTQAEIDAWAKRDPIAMLPRAAGRGIRGRHRRGARRHRRASRSDRAGRARLRPPLARTGSGDGAPATSMPSRSTRRKRSPRSRGTATVTTSWLDAVRDGIAEEMRRDPHIIYFGEGTGERGGTFAHTKGLWQEFGPQRMVDTPISEQGFTGAALGASATGARTHRRPDVRRLHVRGRRPDHPAGGEAPLHVERPDERADGGPRRRRRGAQRRPAP